ncbi:MULTISPECIES: arylsulfatase [unclassified Curtobacterium]|uniref:arylsulfatase n=1 Tax=unclassified Curtobacterium TaxID=257496 RepID=UPI0038286C48
MAAVGDEVFRNVLPIPDVERPRFTTYDAKDPEATYPAIAPLRPPEGAPNIVVILIDDAGFGSSSVFGGPCRTPNLERLAGNGLRYTRFHTTALCSPTRAALLSGRNHHTVNMGGITEGATSAPGQTSVRPNTCAPVAETLRLNGYSTAQFGKCHEVPVWETSPMGPFDHWPHPGGGFEYFYGFIGGETSQYYPAIYENVNPVEPDRTPEEGYTFNEDLADHAIAYVNRQKSLTPDKPFFLYYAPGATHAPHHVPAEWADRYRGRFDAGWDALREETFARQRELGVVPADADLTPRTPGLDSWEDTDDAMKPVLARQMEVYAGYMEQTDHHIGRLIDGLEERGILDETLVMVVIGDNGASAEGTLQGTLNEMTTLNGFGSLETPEYLAERIDEIGTPSAYNHYAVAWAHAMNTPYQWTKQVASHWGGTRNGTIVHWPAVIRSGGGTRHQFHHVIDVAPTLLEIAGIPEPTIVHGVQQKPYEGVSLAYTFTDADAAERHTTQYFEMVGNRGIYHDGWTAVTKHRTPWETGAVALPAFDDDVWELYAADDWTQAHDRAADEPDRLRDLQRLWLIEAVKYSVLPLDDRFAERGNPDLAGRPQLVHGDSQRLFPGMVRLTEESVISIKNRSHAVTASVSVPASGADGVVIAQGGRAGGWSLYCVDGVLAYCYNFFGLERSTVRGTVPLAAGDHELRFEFDYDGGGLAKGGTVTLFVDREPIGSGRVDRTEPARFSADETCDVGLDAGSPVSEDYAPTGNGFSGAIHWVQIDTGDLAEEHRAAAQALHLSVAYGTQ